MRFFIISHYHTVYVTGRLFLFLCLCIVCARTRLLKLSLSEYQKLLSLNYSGQAKTKAYFIIYYFN